MTPQITVAAGTPGSTATDPVVLDDAVRVLSGGAVLLGGDPTRLLRLRPEAAGWRDPVAAGDRSTVALVRTLVHRGLVHPQPPPYDVIPAGLVTVVVPVRDRPAELHRCLTALGRAAPVLVVDDGSLDPVAVRAVVERHGADLLTRTVNGGPAVARNDGLAATDTELVAFVDSDCRPPSGWLAALLPHLADPAVAAVAPRVSAAGGARLLARYAAARCPLDLGPRPARVRPGGRVGYLPTAALLLRRSGIVFDEGLRFGEDVDLVWRLHDASGTVRYDPRVVVAHDEPATWRAWLLRRHDHGTSAGPLAARHGNRLAPLRLTPPLAAAGLAALAGRPLPAVAALAVPAVRVQARLRRAGLTHGDAIRAAVATVGGAALRTAESVGGAGAACTLLPAAVLLARRRTRVAGAALLAVPPLLEWARRRPRIDPVRWTALRLVEDVAYASGVWRSCLRERTVTPLTPAGLMSAGGRPARVGPTRGQTSKNSPIVSARTTAQ